MIELYTAPTPNGHKVSCTLEALGMDYKAILVNLSEGEQKKPDFLKISPNGRIPAIVDTSNNLSIFESGAIMIYLADKSNKLISTNPEKRAKVLEWLMFQMGGIGPNLTYSAAKAGLLAMTFNLARELAKTGVTVNCIMPGPADTGLHFQSPPDMLEKAEQSHPMGRLTTPEDVWPSVLYLASEESAHINGEGLDVNGGFWTD